MSNVTTRSFALTPSLALVACALPSAQLDTSAAPSATSPPKLATEREPRRGARPEVLHAELLEGGRLRLTLSEPLAPVDAVAPGDFRLSLALRYAYPGYAYAYYYDIGDELGEGQARFESVALGERDDLLELTFTPPIPLPDCVEIETEAKMMTAESRGKARAGLFLHYAPGERPVANKQGKALRGFGAAWVLHGEAGEAGMHVEGPPARTAMRDLIPVQCGPVLPPGPR